jgi:hypothetical protein
MRHLAMRPLAMGAAGAIAGALLTPVLVPMGLGVIGFSAVGPVAGEFPSWPTGRVELICSYEYLELLGSLAAVIQSGIGNVAAGSLFAGAQSIAMGGAFPAAITAIGAGVAGIGAAAASAKCGDKLSMARRRRRQATLERELQKKRMQLRGRLKLQLRRLRRLRRLLGNF